MLEIIPILTLALCMPLDATPPPIPVRAEDLAMFPAHHVVSQERELAWHHYEYAKERAAFSNAHGLPDAAYWNVMIRRAHFVWDQIDDLVRAHEANNADQTAYWLRRFKSFAGPLRYVHGQLPPHVDVSEPEPVEVVPLP